MKTPSSTQASATIEQDPAPRVSLDTLGDGSARERFQVELDRVVKNILDPNTHATAKREINLKVTIVPTEGRSECATLIEASSKLAGMKGAGCTIFVGLQNGEPVARSYNPAQMNLGFDAIAQIVPPTAGDRKAAAAGGD